MYAIRSYYANHGRNSETRAGRADAGFFVPAIRVAGRAEPCLKISIRKQRINIRYAS